MQFKHIQDKFNGKIMYRVLEKNQTRKCDIHILGSHITRTSEYSITDYIDLEWTSFDKVRLTLDLYGPDTNQAFISIPNGITHLIITSKKEQKLEQSSIPATVKHLFLENVNTFFGRGTMYLPNLLTLHSKGVPFNTAWNTIATNLRVLKIEAPYATYDTFTQMGKLEQLDLSIPKMDRPSIMSNLKKLQKDNSRVIINLLCDEDLAESVSIHFLKSSISSVVNPKRITINGRCLTTFHYEQPKVPTPKKATVLSHRPVIVKQRRPRKPRQKSRIPKLPTKKRYENE